MAPPGYGQSWDQVKPANGTSWGESESADQYETHPFVGDDPPRSGVPFNDGDSGGSMRR